MSSPPPVQVELTHRERSIVMFALWRFMHDAHAHADAAAQDKHAPSGAVGHFHKDANDAAQLITKLRRVAGEIHDDSQLHRGPGAIAR